MAPARKDPAKLTALPTVPTFRTFPRDLAFGKTEWYHSSPPLSQTGEAARPKRQEHFDNRIEVCRLCVKGTE